MCQYDTDARAQGHPHPRAGILQKMKLKKGHNSHNNGRFYPKSNFFKTRKMPNALWAGFSKGQ